jgi:hypothetical protein
MMFYSMYKCAVSETPIFGYTEHIDCYRFTSYATIPNQD